MIELRHLTSVADCRRVVAVQEAVWGQGSEIVPASVLVASAKRGGILIGATDGDRLVGFVWSMPAWRDGQPSHWSHMLAVVPDARGDRIGVQLKLAQRERALANGIDLIEWTFDPLQAANAHLNFAMLGCVVTTYLVDAYGDMQGPLHRGTATDRFIAEWWLRRPHVERRVSRLAGDAGRSMLAARSADVRDAPQAIDVRQAGQWWECAAPRLELDSARLFVPIPPDFTRMQREAPDLARTWRLTTREALTTYLGRAYRVVDFLRDRDSGGGQYLLHRETEPV